MIALEFLAHDLAGLELSGTTDGSYCLWKGSEEQFANADYYIAYHNEYGNFPKIDED